MLVLGIETSTPRTSLALGTEHGVVASASFAAGQAAHELVVPAVEQLFGWSDLKRSSLSGIAVGLGPGLFTGMRVGIATAKTMAQVLGVPVLGFASLDLVAFAYRHSRSLVCATIDARRRELFYAFYRPVPGGVAREGGFEVASAPALAAELEARKEEVLLVGNGALVYRRQLEQAGSHVEVDAGANAFPSAVSLVELAVPRLEREEFDRVYDLQPIYVRKSDAEIAWDERRRRA
jgi:tRNA threonylcarbamoyladenosine biosynthesis protein TsaB